MHHFDIASQVNRKRDATVMRGLAFVEQAH